MKSFLLNSVLVSALLLSLLVLASTVLAVLPTGPTNITLAWDPGTSIDQYFIYSSTNAGSPMPWGPYTNTAGTNNSITVQIIPGAMFFYVTASNFWGESGPSNTAGTPPVPKTSGLKIIKGP